MRQIIEQDRIVQQPGDTSTISTSNANITQSFPIQHTSPRNYEPSPAPPQYSSHTSPHNSPQQGPSNAPIAGAVQSPLQIQFQSTTPT